MSRQIANPLANVIAAARKALPPTNGATARAHHDRTRPRRQMILADVSASMAEMAGSRPKVQVLSDALASVPHVETLAFSSWVQPVPAGTPLPEPSGGTALHIAIDHALASGATDLLVISDGHPDAPSLALEAADRFRGRIDVIYCGPETDCQGLAFMRRLARGGGAAHHRSLSKPQLVLEEVRRLALPRPGGSP